jgi:hypothetical protein
MTVTTQGAITVSPFDLTTTHRGTEIAIKVRSDFGVICACERIGGEWTVVEDLLFFGQDGTADADVEIAKAGGAPMWVKTKLLPLINAWLAARFKPAAAPAPTPAPSPGPNASAFELIDAAIFRLQWARAADGTIKVTAP